MQLLAEANAAAAAPGIIEPVRDDDERAHRAHQIREEHAHGVLAVDAQGGDAERRAGPAWEAHSTNVTAMRCVRSSAPGPADSLQAVK